MYSNGSTPAGIVAVTRCGFRYVCASPAVSCTRKICASVFFGLPDLSRSDNWFSTHRAKLAHMVSTWYAVHPSPGNPKNSDGLTPYLCAVWSNSQTPNLSLAKCGQLLRLSIAPFKNRQFITKRQFFNGQPIRPNQCRPHNQIHNRTHSR